MNKTSNGNGASVLSSELVRVAEEMIYTMPEFAKIIDGVISALPNQGKDLELDTAALSQRIFGNNPERSLLNIIDLSLRLEKGRDRSIVLRGVVYALLSCLGYGNNNNCNNVDVRSLWPILYETLSHESELDMVSSIGSQRFLSVPIWIREKNDKYDIMLRLHVWHRNIEDKYSDLGLNEFGIHAHMAHGTSWVIRGKISDTTYDVSNTDLDSEWSFFRVEYVVVSELDTNRKTSIAINTGKKARVNTKSKKTCTEGQSYSIDAGVYHSSESILSEDSGFIVSTLFLFDSGRGSAPVSEAVGPSGISDHEVIRKSGIDANVIINDVNTSMKLAST